METIKAKRLHKKGDLKTSLQTILINEQLNVDVLWRYAKDRFGMDKKAIEAVVKHSRDFTKTSIDKVLICLNEITGKTYTYNDILDRFEF